MWLENGVHTSRVAASPDLFTKTAGHGVQRAVPRPSMVLAMEKDWQGKEQREGEAKEQRSDREREGERREKERRGGGKRESETRSGRTTQRDSQSEGKRRRSKRPHVF